jgi:hypothetical protein
MIWRLIFVAAALLGIGTSQLFGGDKQTTFVGAGLASSCAWRVLLWLATHMSELAARVTSTGPEPNAANQVSGAQAWAEHKPERVNSAGGSH